MALAGNRYTVTITGNANGAIGIVTFFVNLENQCPSATLVPSSLPTWVYLIGSGAQTKAFTDFILSNALCGPITYTTTLDSATFDYVTPH
jgi:hypothetical protein